MTFEYGDLKGRIVQKFGSVHNLCVKMGCSDSSMSEKLCSNVPFSQKNIFDMCELLDIDQSEIARYFFTVKVR